MDGQPQILKSETKRTVTMGATPEQQPKEGRSKDHKEQGTNEGRKDVTKRTNEQLLLFFFFFLLLFPPSPCHSLHWQDLYIGISLVCCVVPLYIIFHQTRYLSSLFLIRVYSIIYILLFFFGPLCLLLPVLNPAWPTWPTEKKCKTRQRNKGRVVNGSLHPICRVCTNA